MTLPTFDIALLIDWAECRYESRALGSDRSMGFLVGKCRVIGKELRFDDGKLVEILFFVGRGCRCILQVLSESWCKSII